MTFQEDIYDNHYSWLEPLLDERNYEPINDIVTNLAIECRKEKYKQFSKSNWLGPLLDERDYEPINNIVTNLVIECNKEKFEQFSESERETIIKHFSPMNLAILLKSINTINILKNSGYPISASHLITAIKLDSIEILDIIIKNCHCEDIDEALTDAIELNRINIVEYILNRYHFDPEVIYTAISNCHTEIVKLILDKLKEEGKVDIVELLQNIDDDDDDDDD